MLKLIIAALLSLSSLTAFADGHTKEAQEITKEEQKKAAEKGIVKGPNNVIPFDFSFNEFSIDFLLEEIQDAVNEGDKTIIIKWNSGGGSIFAGFKLIHKILELQEKGVKFVGVVDRLCGSMCFQTLQFMDVRLAYPLAMIMDHPSSGGEDVVLHEISELLMSNVRMRMVKKGLSPIAIKLYERLILSNFFMNNSTSIQLGLMDKVILPGSERLIPVKPIKKEVKKAVKK